MKPILKPLRIPASIALLLLVFFITGSCTTSFHIPPNPGKSILYAVRQDAAVSTDDVIKVSLNGKEVGKLNADTYMAFHLLPGEYEILYLIYDEEGAEKDSFGFSGMIEADTQYSSSIVYNFGWRGWERYDVGGSLMGRLTFLGDFDLTSELSPK